MKIRCLKPPVYNYGEGIQLWAAGQEANIKKVTRWWQNEIDAGNVEIVKKPENDETAKD